MDKLHEKVSEKAHEAVNYICSYLYNTLPRRKVDAFGEELESLIICYFDDIRLNDISENDMVITVSPMEVTCQIGKNAKSVCIHMRECKANWGMKPHHISIAECRNFRARSPLSALNTPLAPEPEAILPNHKIISYNELQFTVGSFAATRFGNTKPKASQAKIEHLRDLRCQRSCCWNTIDSFDMEGGSGSAASGCETPQSFGSSDGIHKNWRLLNKNELSPRKDGSSHDAILSTGYLDIAQNTCDVQRTSFGNL
ncbi:unnamed protein product [Soboliphyme baturini]|uniref:Chorein_N domain-containing protein n=1 Tax=Soboliphyme baturini TaxID=241478 RepID=A0A183ISA1_9BILA|nr:unnamed protein product [Soboliphyme baturini]